MVLFGRLYTVTWLWGTSWSTSFPGRWSWVSSDWPGTWHAWRAAAATDGETHGLDTTHARHATHTLRQAHTHAIQLKILAIGDEKTEIFHLWNGRLHDVASWHSGYGLNATLVIVALLYNVDYGFKSRDCPIQFVDKLFSRLDWLFSLVSMVLFEDYHSCWKGT